jgi:nucleotide-binding universal stress UspA family protein
MYEKILICLDGTPDSEVILNEVEKLVKNAPTTLVLLNVGVPIDSSYALQEAALGYTGASAVLEEKVAGLSTSDERDRHAYLAKVGERFTGYGCKIVTEVGYQAPADEILYAAKLHQVGLIAMATHGRTGLAKLLRGSVTESVMEHAPCPLLVIRTVSH